MKKSVIQLSSYSVTQLFSYSVIIMLFSISSVFAQGGTTGPLTWHFENGTLTISGRGEMPDYGLPSPGNTPAPWYGYIINTVIIENGVLNIGKNAFAHSGFQSIVIPNSVTRIGMTSFLYCVNLKSIVIPNSVKNIENGAFVKCYDIVSITLPNSIIEFEDGVFYDCNNLATITNLNPVPYSINPLTFGNLELSAITLYVPSKSVPLYKKAEVWKEFNIVGGVDIDEEEPGDGNQLLVFPNPTTGACSITMPDEFLYERFLVLSVYDASGKLIQQIEIDNDSPEKVSLKLDHKAQGVYVVTLSNGRRSYTGKVVFN